MVQIWNKFNAERTRTIQSHYYTTLVLGGKKRKDEIDRDRDLSYKLRPTPIVGLGLLT